MTLDLRYCAFKESSSKPEDKNAASDGKKKKKEKVKFQVDRKDDEFTPTP